MEMMIINILLFGVTNLMGLLLMILNGTLILGQEIGAGAMENINIIQIDKKMHLLRMEN